MAHHPAGLMIPVTSLQAAGGCHWMQPSQRAAPFGLAWYCTSFCDILLDAKAGVIAWPPTEIAATPVAARRMMSRRECFAAIGLSVMFSVSQRFGAAVSILRRECRQSGKLPKHMWDPQSLQDQPGHIRLISRSSAKRAPLFRQMAEWSFFVRIGRGGI